MNEPGHLSVQRSALNVESSGHHGGDPSSVDNDSPWPGLAPFTEDQSRLFFGRDAEIKTLSRRVQGDPLTVLFGQSGLGKSSLLQAGVFPRLRSADFCPVYIRLDHSPGALSLGEQVKQTVLAEAARAGQWTKADFARPGESLWEFFHHRDNRLVSPGGIPLSPVLVFDQFEELFTLGGASGAERQRAVAFMTELAELVENRPPDALVARVEQSTAELDAFDFGATDYRVVITLREDYLPHLESLKTIMPALMDNRMRLTRMNGVQALEAVVKPGAGLVTDEVARAIVEFVAGARGGSAERLAELDVEPPLLSIICRELNERRRALGHAQITADLVTGNRREILTDFYERCVADLPEAMRTFVEDHLLTKSGFRDNLSLESALDFPGVTRPLINTLVDRRLLRIEDRLGVERVELTHDVLAEVIRSSRDAHQQQRALDEAQARERLTRRRMWLARTIAAALLVGLTGVSWVAWRAIHAEREQTRLRADAERLRAEAQAQELAALRQAYASDMNGVQHALANENLGRARELLNRHRPDPGETDLRGWEWRYLWQFCQSDALSVLKAENDNSVQSLSVSADGEWLAVGNYFGGGLSLVNLKSKEEVRVPAGNFRVHVAFSPREPLLAFSATERSAVESATAGNEFSTAAKNRIFLWDVRTRKVVRELVLDGSCYHLAFSADGQTLVALQSVRTLNVSTWRVSDGTQLAKWSPARRGSSPLMVQLAITPDAAQAVVGGPAGAVIIDLKTGEERLSLPGDCTTVAITSDGAVIATAPADSGAVATIQLWDAATGHKLASLAGHQGRIGQLTFLPNGRQLLSASADQTLRLWDLESGTPLRTFRGHKTEVWRLALLRDQRTLVSGCKDGSVYSWDLQSTRESSVAGSFELGRRGGRAFVDGGRAIITVDLNGSVARRQGRMFEENNVLFEIGPLAYARRGQVSDSFLTAFDANRPWTAVITEAGRLQVWDWERRSLVVEIPDLDVARWSSLRLNFRDGARVGLRFSPDAETIAYREWDIASGREIHSYRFPFEPTSRECEAFSCDGRLFLIFPYPSGYGQVFDVETGKARRLSLNLLEPGGMPAFSPDGTVLAVPSLRSSLRIFDLSKDREVAQLRGYMFGVHSAAFSPDGKRAASGGTGNEAVTMWDVESHERLLVLPTQVSQLSSVTFSPDGNVLTGYSYSGANGGKVMFWRAPSWAEIENAESAGKGKL